jgi:hypothetical protein
VHNDAGLTPAKVQQTMTVLLTVSLPNVGLVIKALRSCLIGGIAGAGQAVKRRQYKERQ